MTTLLPITRNNLRAVIRLAVRPDQDGLVATNAVTLAEVAYDQPGSYVWALADGETPVGLLAMVHPAEYPWMEEGDDPEGAYVWRLMVGAEHQGRGHGRAGLELAIEQARAWGLPRICLSVADKPNSALAFYEAHGFARTGRVIEGELELSRET